MPYELAIMILKYTHAPTLATTPTFPHSPCQQYLIVCVYHCIPVCDQYGPVTDPQYCSLGGVW